MRGQAGKIVHLFLRVDLDGRGVLSFRRIDCHPWVSVWISR